MIELRWLESCLQKKLQYRTLGDAIFLPSGATIREWSEWIDVPTEGIL